MFVHWRFSARNFDEVVKSGPLESAWHSWRGCNTSLPIQSLTPWVQAAKVAAHAKEQSHRGFLWTITLWWFPNILCVHEMLMGDGGLLNTDKNCTKSTDMAVIQFPQSLSFYCPVPMHIQLITSVPRALYFFFNVYSYQLLMAFNLAARSSPSDSSSSSTCCCACCFCAILLLGALAICERLSPATSVRICTYRVPSAHVYGGGNMSWNTGSKKSLWVRFLWSSCCLRSTTVFYSRNVPNQRSSVSVSTCLS